MRQVTCHDGRLLIGTGTFDAVDASSDSAAPRLELGHVHELLTTGGVPRTVAVWLSLAAGRRDAVVWCEPGDGPHPPALAAAGVLPQRVVLLRPKSIGEALWAVTESLRCRGVGVTVAVADRLTPVEARRLQLAAERGGGVGLLIRRPDAPVHAARTRWRIWPEPGEAMLQRWRMRRVHGQGRPSDEDLLLEVNRETNHVRATAVLADRPRETTPAVATG